uniref:Uncharacterized protein n=1 Tax=Bracon brevicornis TaxID=1563983 RepID=A0A6V7IZ82_9HYME
MIVTSATPVQTVKSAKIFIRRCCMMRTAPLRPRGYHHLLEAPFNPSARVQRESANKEEEEEEETVSDSYSFVTVEAKN